MTHMNQLLILGIIMLFTGMNIYGQQGTICSDPLTANSGNNVFPAQVNSTIWYAYKATQTGKITVASCGNTSDDTQVKVYPGSKCPPQEYEKIAESDDHCETQSKVAFIGTAGNDYLIVWTNQTSSNTFNWSLTEEEWQQGEMCSDPKTATASANNVCDHSNGTDQWFSYVANGNGTVTVSSCGQTTLDTKLSVYTGCSDLLMIDTNDDDCNSQSALTFDCVAGTEYLIEWKDTDGNDTYNWSLTFDGTSTDIATEKTKDLSIAPNPTTGRFIVNGQIEDEMKVTLHDLSGGELKSLVVNDSNREIDISELADGLYLLILKSNTEQSVLKVIKR